MEFREKWKFFVNRSVPENFQWENFLGQVPTESLRTQDSENVYERWVQQIFDPVLPARSWEMPVKCELPAKIGRCSKKLAGHNFDQPLPHFGEGTQPLGLLCLWLCFR